MHVFNRLALVLAVFLVLAGTGEARTKKGDKFLKEGRAAQLAEEWVKALEAYEKALAEDPSDPLYQMAVRRTRFEASQALLKTARKLRDEGKLEEALKELQRAYAYDPGSTIVEQELRTTYRMIERAEKKGKEEGAKVEDKGLPPAELAKRQAEERMSRIQDIPELRPISPSLNTLRMNNQPIRVLYETVGKLAGINVVFDPDFQPQPKNYSVDLTNASLEEALRYLSLLTKTYWKPLTANTIYVTEDSVTKRRDHEEMVVKVFYLKNITKVQDLQEIATAVRSVTDIRRFFPYNAQNVLIVRGTVDQVALAEKLILDLDKALPEVVVDVIVMEANRTRTRDLAATLMSGGKAGISIPISFAPGGVTPPTNGDGDGANGGGSTSSGTIPMGQLGSLSINDWAVSLPGALLQALMSDRSTRILQRPQVRAADGQKASLRLGDRFPYATGSFQPGVGAVGVSPLVSTQFQFADVGVNVDLTPKIHGDQDISIHVEIEISTVRDRIDVGGLSQPVIGQRKVTEDIRVRDGEVTLLGGLTQDQSTLTKSGVPGLADIPIIKWLGFSSENKERNEGELLVALVPHIVRKVDIDEINVRGVAAGTDQVVKVNFASKPVPPGAEPAPAKTAPAKPQAPVTAVKPEEAAPEQPPTAPAVPEPRPEEAPPPPDPGMAEQKTPESPKPSVATRLEFNPGTVVTKRGGAFTVSLSLANATDVYNVPIKVKFDPRLLRLNEIERGTMLGGDGQQVIFTRNILNDSGDASVILNRLPGSRGVSGSGTLIQLQFQAVEAGATTITLPEITVRNSQMQPITVQAPVVTVNIQAGP